MVLFPGELVKSSLPRDIDRRQPPVVEQRFDRAIDGRDAEACDTTLRGLESLVRRERSALGFESASNREFLFGRSFDRHFGHERILSADFTDFPPHRDSAMPEDCDGGSSGPAVENEGDAVSE